MSDEEIRNKVSSWLAEQGYPLEMKVAAAFQSKKFNVRQSTFYHDPETTTPREIDVVASKGTYIDGTFAKIVFVIECKSTIKKPWIIFSRNNEIIDYEYVDWYCCSDAGADYVLHASIDGKFDSFPLTYHLRDRIGYGITQAFTSGEDVAYKAMHSAGRCAVSYINAANKAKYGPVVDIVIPVIVIEGGLFDANLSDTNVLNISAIKEGVILWDTIIGDRKSLAIHLVTLDQLDAFVEKASETADNLILDWRNNLTGVLKEMEEIRTTPALKPKRSNKSKRRSRKTRR